MLDSTRDVLRFGGAALVFANSTVLLLSFMDALTDAEAMEAARSTAMLPTLLLIVGTLALAIGLAGER